MLISWAPMLLLIGVWVFFAQRAQRIQRKQQDYMVVVQTYVAEHIAKTKRVNQNLERTRVRWNVSKVKQARLATGQKEPMAHDSFPALQTKTT